MKQIHSHRKQQQNILSHAAPTALPFESVGTVTSETPPNDLGGCGSSSEPAAVGNKSLVPRLVQTQVYADLEAESKI